MMGADVGERDDARCDQHLTAPKSSDEFGVRTAAATHAQRVSNVKSNPEATRLDRPQGLFPRDLRRVDAQSQSA